MRDLCNILFVAAVWLAFALLLSAGEGSLPSSAATHITSHYEWRITPSGQQALMRCDTKSDIWVQVGVWVPSKGHYLPRLAPGKFGGPTLPPVEPPRERQMERVP